MADRPVKSEEQKRAEAEARATARSEAQQSEARQAELEEQGAEATGGTRDPEREFTVGDLLARAEQYLRTPRHVLAAALHGRPQDESMTLAEARSSIEQFLEHPVAEDEHEVAA